MIGNNYITNENIIHRKNITIQITVISMKSPHFFQIKINMKVQFEKETQNRSNAHTIVELCAIRDGKANCDVMSCT